MCISMRRACEKFKVIVNTVTFIFSDVRICTNTRSQVGFVFKFLITRFATRLEVSYKAGPVDPEVKQLSTFATGERVKVRNLRVKVKRIRFLTTFNSQDKFMSVMFILQRCQSVLSLGYGLEDPEFESQ